MRTIAILRPQALLTLTNSIKSMYKATLSIALVFLLAILFSAACGKKKAMANTREETPDVNIPDPEINAVIIDEGFVPPKENGRFEVDGMEMLGNELHLKVRYSGGCEEHIFNLYSNNMYAKTYPPQLTLFLEHIDNNDRCRAMIMKELVFDVSGIEYPGTSEVILRLNNTEETLQYKY